MFCDIARVTLSAAFVRMHTPHYFLFQFCIVGAELIRSPMSPAVQLARSVIETKTAIRREQQAEHDALAWQASQDAAAAAAAAATAAQNEVATAMAAVAGSSQTLVKSDSAPVLAKEPAEPPSPASVIPEAAAMPSTKGNKGGHRARLGLVGSASAQSLDMKRRAPSFGFGKASREQSSKLFVSQQHSAAAHTGAHSPPSTKYTMLPAIATLSPDGSKPNQPSYSLSKADRFAYGYGKSEARPGPTHYHAGTNKLPGSVGAGKQADSSKPDAPYWRFGTSTRDDAQKVYNEIARPADYTPDSPGPAKYNLPAAVGGGKQPDGRRGPDPPLWTLAARVRITDDSERSPGAIYPVARGIGKMADSRFRTEPSWNLAGRARIPSEPLSPGPGSHEALTAIGRQVDGHKASAPKRSFTKSDRWAQHDTEQAKHPVPGPGYYG